MRVLLLASILFFTSCSPERRLANLLERHPELVKVDTVFRYDTIIVEARSVDTLFYYNQTDTVIVKDGGATVTYYYNVKDSTVYLKGSCDTIRIIREVPTEIHSVEAKPQTWYQRLWAKTKDLLIILMLGALIVLFLLQKKKPIASL